MAVVYKHIRKKDNICFYVGVGNNNIRSKVKSHRSKFWKNETSKYDYYIEIYKDNLTFKEALEIEIKLIAEIGRRDLGLGTLVNLTNGGEGSTGYVPTKEHRIKISKSMIGKNKGENNPMYGKNPYQDKIHYSAKKIINTETNEIYNTINEVIKIIGIPKTTFLRWLRNPKLNKTVYQYHNIN